MERIVIPIASTPCIVPYENKRMVVKKKDESKQTNNNNNNKSI